MRIDEVVRQRVQRLPAPLQAEVLDFVEYLTAREERESAAQDRSWSNLSLAWAMRGMENEGGPVYTLADLKEVFS